MIYPARGRVLLVRRLPDIWQYTTVMHRRTTALGFMRDFLSSPNYLFSAGIGRGPRQMVNADLHSGI